MITNKNDHSDEFNAWLEGGPFPSIVVGYKLHDCPRCGHDHEEITYHRFHHPIIAIDGTTWGYWGTCPITGDPILLNMITRNSDEFHASYIKEKPITSFGVRKGY